MKIMAYFKIGYFSAIVLMLAVSAVPAQAVNHQVDIVGFAFSPASLSISAGDTVTWTNQDGANHTSTSDDGTTWDSGTLTTSQSYSFTFNGGGTFPYHCEFHPSMTAVIEVSGGVAPVPGLNAWGILILIAMLAAGGLLLRRKKKVSEIVGKAI